MRPITLILLVCLGTGQSFAAAKADEMNLLQQLREEVAARRVVREHESGTKKATDAELASARAVIRQAE